MATAKSKYVAVHRLVYGDPMNEKGEMQTFKAGEAITADLGQSEIDRLLESGAIQLASDANAEAKARESAASNTEATVASQTAPASNKK